MTDSQSDIPPTAAGEPANASATNPDGSPKLTPPAAKMMIPATIAAIAAVAVYVFLAGGGDDGVEADPVEPAVEIEAAAE